MVRSIGVRREDKSDWERRVPITPAVARQLREQHGIQAFVQPSSIRVFSESEFEEHGAVVQEDLSDCPVVFGVKEIPAAHLRRGGAYMFFSHVIKGQAHNMGMLRRLMELECTLIDYEKVTDEAGRRLIFFGRHAGLAGTVETLRALGHRLAGQGLPNPFQQLRHAHQYRDISEAKAAVARAGDDLRRDGIPERIAPLTIGVTGYGNVARGAWEILDLLPIEVIDPHELAEIAQAPAASRHKVYGCTFREQHLVEPLDRVEGEFDCQRYYDCPDNFGPIFDRYLPHLTVVVNAIYWDARYPRLITKADLRGLWEGAGSQFGHAEPKLKVIGDISCDVEGSIEATVKSTSPDSPTYVYDPLTGEVDDGLAGEGLVIMAVDILPSELPRDASEDFSRVLEEYIPAIAAADFSVPFDDLALPAPIKRAVILHRGQLTPDYGYIGRYLE